MTKRPPPPQQKKAPHSDAACGHSSALQVRHRGPKITGLPPSQHRGLLCHQQLEVERTAPRSVPAVKYKDALPSSQDDAEEGGRVVGRHTDLIFSVFLSTQNFVKTATKFGENELELLSCDRFKKKKKEETQPGYSNCTQMPIISSGPWCAQLLQASSIPLESRGRAALALGTLRPAVSARTGFGSGGQGPRHPALQAAAWSYMLSPRNPGGPHPNSRARPIPRAEQTWPLGPLSGAPLKQRALKGIGF